ncbi:MAG TPA: HAD family hydrolase [Gemmatimonadaceae bacterium]|nr:HAD family hydrolase [Gemmatimonadaceae bacterium]
MSDAVPAPRPAAFVDRDGTIIEDVHYLARPEDVRLVPGAADALRRLATAEVPIVIVTNQSGIARGYFTEAQYARVAERVADVLREAGVPLLATYHCPHHPAVTGPCACRKPGVLLYERAAHEHGLDLARSLYVGDRWRDVAPALRLGGMGILVPSADTPDDDRVRAEREAAVTRSLADAVSRFLAGHAKSGTG